MEYTAGFYAQDPNTVSRITVEYKFTDCITTAKNKMSRRTQKKGWRPVGNWKYNESQQEHVRDFKTPEGKDRQVFIYPSLY